MQFNPASFIGKTKQEIRAIVLRAYKENGYDDTVSDSLVDDIFDLANPGQATKAIKDVNLKPTEAMANAAKRGLKLREEHGRGGTSVGVARARDISNRKDLSPSTVKRMKSFFARHEVDLDAPAAKEGNEGYPSAGLIAWLLWGGDPGKTWAENKVDELERAGKKSLVQKDAPDDCGTGAGGFKEDNTCATGESAIEGPSQFDELRGALESASREGGSVWGIPVVAGSINKEYYERAGLTGDDIDTHIALQQENIFDKDEWDDARFAVEQYTGSESDRINELLREQEEIESSLNFNTHVPLDDPAVRNSRKALGRIVDRMKEEIEGLEDPTEEQINELSFRLSNSLASDFSIIEKYGNQLASAEEAISDLLSEGYSNEYAGKLYDVADTLKNAEFTFSDIESAADLDGWIENVEDAIGSAYTNSNLFNDAIQYGGLDLRNNLEIDALDRVTRQPLSGGKPVRVFRGIKLYNSNAREILQNFADIDRDGYFTTEAFASTTIDNTVAKTFAGSSNRIVLDIEAIHGAYVAPISAHSMEKEVLLPRGYRYEILDRTWVWDPQKQRGMLYIKARQTDESS